VPRVLPDGLAAEIDATSWPFPDVCRWLKSIGGITADEMARTFNCGLGMIAVVAPEQATKLSAVLENAGERVYHVGRLVPRRGRGGLILNGAEQAWRS
jgi:phosphoribosylaminoimidazole (AIR) synthetase